MRVFDLYCHLDHVFEGWFGSEEDFAQQLERGLIECPMCGSKQLRKGLSAPRLNLGAAKQSASTSTDTSSASRKVAANTSATQAPQSMQALQTAWLQVAREIVQNTEDVGEHFAEQALRMHKGEEPERPIRGQATREQTLELLEEGVPVLPLVLPKKSQETLQ